MVADKTTDPTLGPMPHVVAVATGAITGFLTTKVGISPEYASMVAIAVASAMTTVVHWIQAKLAA